MSIIAHTGAPEQTGIDVGDKVGVLHGEGINTYRVPCTVMRATGTDLIVDDGLGEYRTPRSTVTLISKAPAVADDTEPNYQIGDTVTVDGKPARIVGYGALGNARNAHGCADQDCARWDIEGDNLPWFAWACQMAPVEATVIQFPATRADAESVAVLATAATAIASLIELSADGLDGTTHDTATAGHRQAILDAATAIVRYATTQCGWEPTSPTAAALAR